MRNVKCSDCDEYRNEWCEKVKDSPHPDLARDCQYWHERKNRDDCISRQAAIDATQGIGRLATLPDNDAVIRMSAVEYVLFNLPSAQPEIIRCKDCRHRDTETGFCEGRGWPMQLVPDDGFCDKGERSEE